MQTQTFLNTKEIDYTLYCPSKVKKVIIFGHSAGSDMYDQNFEQLAQHMAADNIAIFSIQFPYRKEKRPVADAVHKSTGAFAKAIQIARSFQVPIFIGGRSYGGRVASHYLASQPCPDVAGCVCLSFPLKPKKTSDLSRGDHLKQINIPTLIIQGERDSMGHPKDFDSFLNSASSLSVVSLPFADHSLLPLKKHPVTALDLEIQISKIILQWCDAQVKINSNIQLW